MTRIARLPGSPPLNLASASSIARPVLLLLALKLKPMVAAGPADPGGTVFGEVSLTRLGDAPIVRFSSARNSLSRSLVNSHRNSVSSKFPYRPLSFLFSASGVVVSGSPKIPIMI